MADRPIIFSALMVRALSEGWKMQTRRLLRIQPLFVPEGKGQRGFWQMELFA